MLKNSGPTAQETLHVCYTEKLVLFRELIDFYAENDMKYTLGAKLRFF
jgi:hypothetical protein